MNHTLEFHIHALSVDKNRVDKYTDNDMSFYDSTWPGD